MYERVWDEADYVVPPAENGAFFVTTNVVITPNQTRGICPEVRLTHFPSNLSPEMTPLLPLPLPVPLAEIFLVLGPCRGPPEYLFFAGEFLVLL